MLGVLLVSVNEEKVVNSSGVTVIGSDGPVVVELNKSSPVDELLSSP